MKMKSGDKIKFGITYCNKTGRRDLLNKTIMLIPQAFEDDNGLYSSESFAPGIFNSIEEEADSIYHLFGNNLDGMYDCVVIPATEDDLKILEDQKLSKEKAIEDDYNGMVDFFLKEEVKKEVIRAYLVGKEVTILGKIAKITTAYFGIDDEIIIEYKVNNGGCSHLEFKNDMLTEFLEVPFEDIPDKTDEGFFVLAQTGHNSKRYIISSLRPCIKYY